MNLSDKPTTPGTHNVTVQRVCTTTETIRDCVAVETAVVIAINGKAFITMMATPQDCIDLATGFLLSEGIIQRTADCIAIDESDIPAGKLIAIQLSETEAYTAFSKHRHLESRTGCGVCGIASPDLFHAAPQIGPAFEVTREVVLNAMACLNQNQPLRKLTGMTHAAALFDLAGNLLLIREDVGRHNALDKLIGALALSDGLPTATSAPSFVVLTSRASFEMVQKAANVGLCFVVAASAPTSLAIEVAQRSDVTLLCRVRHDMPLMVYHEGQRQLLR